MALALMPMSAHAHGKPPTDEENKRALGGGAERMPNGLYRVRLKDGTEMYSHGADPKEAAAAPTTGFELGAAESNPTCVNHDAPQMAVLYGRPSGTADRYWEVRADLQAAVRRMDAVLNGAALTSGGTEAHFKVQCAGASGISVESFVNSSGAHDFASIVAAAKAAGFTAKNKKFLIFYDGDIPYACGVADYRDDERASADNANNDGAMYAAVSKGCWFGRTPMHENGHNMGATQRSAPDSTGSGGHCNDLYDVMCYAPDGGDRNQTEVTACPDRMYFDCGYDTYFDAAPESGEWLATHWNVGSRVNKFLAFGTDVNGSVSYSGVQRGKFEWHSFGDYVLVADTSADGYSARVNIVRNGEQKYTCTDSDGANNGWKKCDWDMPEGQGVWMDIGMMSSANVYQAISAHYFGRS